MRYTINKINKGEDELILNYKEKNPEVEAVLLFISFRYLLPFFLKIYLLKDIYKQEFIWKILLSIHQEISFVHPYETNALHFS